MVSKAFHLNKHNSEHLFCDCLPTTLLSADLTEWISLSHATPKCGAAGGLKWKDICRLASWSFRSWLRLAQVCLNSFSPALKFVPWSEYNSAGVPWRAINLLSAMRNESMLMLVRTSRCTPHVVRYLKIIPHLFSLRLPILMRNGPKQSIPVEWKGGFESLSLAGGKSPIFGTAGLAFHLPQSKQWS